MILTSDQEVQGFSPKVCQAHESEAGSKRRNISIIVDSPHPSPQNVCSTTESTTEGHHPR